MTKKAIKDKVTRLREYEGCFDRGEVFFLPGTEKGVEQLLSFPHGAHDDRCLVGDTMITVLWGDKRIADVVAWDYVMTRLWWKKVICAWCTGISEVIENAGIKGTHNHPVITKNGVKLLANITESDILYIWNDKQLYIIESNIIDIQTRKESNTLTTSGLIQKITLVLSHFTDRSGLMNIEKYRKGIIYIIKTVIFWITKSKITNVFHTAIIQKFTWTMKREESNHPKMLSKIIEKCRKPQKYGEQATSEKGGIQTMQKILYSEKSESVLVITAEKNTKQKCEWKQDFVLRDADGKRAQKNGEKNIQTIPRDIIKQRVYNLHVEDCHEYFANGVLVHNCDAMVYSFEKSGGIAFGRA